MGQGGSTELIGSLITQHVLPRSFRAFSVESDARWTALLRQRSPLVREAELLGSLRLHIASYGPMREYGHPESARSNSMLIDDSRVRRAALQYVRAPFQGTRQLGVALVDGRFRVACALEALKHAHNGRHAAGMGDRHAPLTASPAMARHKSPSSRTAQPTPSASKFLLPDHRGP